MTFDIFGDKLEHLSVKYMSIIAQEFMYLQKA